MLAWHQDENWHEKRDGQADELVYYSIGFARCLMQRIEQERQRRIEAEQQRDETGSENQRLHERVMRLEARIQDCDLPTVCSKCGSNTPTVWCRCGERLK